MIRSVEPRWYAVHTHSGAEFKALAHLTRQGYRTYLPRCSRKIRHARRTQRVVRSFFPRYLFVSLDLTTQGWRAIRSTVGVTNIVCFGDQPAPLPLGFIEGLMSQEDSEGYLNPGPAHRLRSGERVVVLNGPFSHLVGFCEKVTDDARVAILLNLLGRKVRVQLDADAVEAA